MQTTHDTRTPARRRAPHLLALLALALAPASAAATDATPHERTATQAPPAPLEGGRAALLEFAFESASRFPDGDQVRNRSAAQERVVLAALELAHLERATAWAERIDGWRRGTALAACAAAQAERGDVEEAERPIALADEVAQADPELFGQEWRRDRVRTGIAQALTWLGERKRAAGYEAGSADSEVGKVGVVAARIMNPDAFEATLRDLGTILEQGSLDRGRNALATCAALWDRFYDDVERREQLDERVEAVLDRFPLQVAIEHELERADAALAHGDRVTALALVDRAQQRFELGRWNTENHVPLTAVLCAARFRAGDGERARRLADMALARYEQEKGEIPDVFRAETLVPMAEAFHAMGDTPRALEVYALAVREGSHNPNARPRAEDLTMIACSMALVGVEPDLALWKRMAEVRAGLTAPW
jgi:hypothetical protein